MKPRNVFNLGIGTDNLFHTEGTCAYTASVEIANLTNKVGAVQLPVDVQRDALPAAPDGGGKDGDDVLRR